MAVFQFKCAEHGLFKKVLEKGQEDFVCPKCNKTSPRLHNPPDSVSKEVIDQGIHQKPVEIYKDAVRLFKERSNSNRND